MVMLLIFGSSINCSKAHDVISPIIPTNTGNEEYSLEQVDRLFLDLDRPVQHESTGYHPQVIPFIPEDKLIKMDGKSKA
ncbi:MAG: hypothetical protein KJ847_05155 [Firmicutes bacterium]|nr:hypothetical protein [Bacillota bacterium]